MASHRVFISYSAKGCVAGHCAERTSGSAACAPDGCKRAVREKEFVEKLAEYLQPTYDVVWDQNGRTLLAGDDWRANLYKEFARCDAAIVLLTNSSTESAYVPLEAMVLVWRQLLDPNFLVIPVFFAPLDENTVKDSNSRFYGVGLENLQGLKLTHLDGQEQQTYAKIGQGLQRIAASIPLERLSIVHELAALLEPATAPQLEAAAQCASANCADWDPRLPRPFLLALAVLKCNLLTASDALANVVNSLDAHQRQRLCDLILPLWVDLSAAMALQRERQRLIVLNTALPETVHHYIQRAWSHQPRPVQVYNITAVTDGDETELYSVVLNNLYQALLMAFPQLKMSNPTVAKMKNALTLLSRGEPVIHICVEPTSRVTIDALARLQTKLPVRIVYMQPQARAETVGPNAYVVQPALDPEVESNATTEWLAAQIALLQRTTT